MWGVGCGVWGVGCGVWGVVCGVWGVGCGVWVRTLALSVTESVWNAQGSGLLCWMLAVMKRSGRMNMGYESSWSAGTMHLVKG